MKMKKASLATTYKFNIRKPVEFAPTYRLSIATTERILRSSMKSAGIIDGDQVIKHNQPAIGLLTKEIIETKLEVKDIQSLLERRTSKFEGLTEYDQQFIKTFTREAAISFAEYFAKSTNVPASKTIVYVSSDCELYRELKSQYCFRMEAQSKRMKLITAMLATKKYIPTKTLAGISGLASVKSVQSAVQAIRRSAEKKLGLSKFIDGWQDSGYRINPSVMLKKE